MLWFQNKQIGCITEYIAFNNNLSEVSYTVNKVIKNKQLLTDTGFKMFVCCYFMPW